MMAKAMDGACRMALLSHCARQRSASEVGSQSQNGMLLIEFTKGKQGPGLSQAGTLVLSSHWLEGVVRQLQLQRLS